MNIMTLDEMKKHEWIVSWSGGKDSTATIILMHENNIPIKEIRHIEMMFDDNTPANVPMMTDFIYDTKKIFESWGYYVRIIKSIRTMCDEAYRIFQRPKREYLKGTYYGISAVMARRCLMTTVKVKTIDSIKDDNDFHMVGIACDEIKRLERLKNIIYMRQYIITVLNVTDVFLPERIESTTKFL